MTSLFKRFTSKKVKSSSSSDKKKNVIMFKNVLVENEKKRRAKLNFTKDTFRRAQEDEIQETRERFTSVDKDHTGLCHPTSFMKIFNTKTLTSKQIDSLRDYTTESNGLCQYDRTIHYLHCENVEKAVLATELRSETRKRLISQKLMMLREEIRQGIQGLTKMKRTLSAKKILVDFFGFSGISNETIDLTQHIFQDKKKKKIEIEEVLDFILNHISDLLYFRWSPSSSLSDFPSIVSVVRSNSQKEEQRLRRKLYKRLDMEEEVKHSYLWFAREDCEKNNEEEEEYLQHITIVTDKKQKKSLKKNGYKKIFSDLWCKYKKKTSGEQRDDFVRDIALTKRRTRPNLTFQYVGKLASTSSHLWVSTYEDVRDVNFAAVTKSLNELREDVRTYERDKDVDAFELFDSDRNGKVPLREFRAALKLIGACDGLREKEIVMLLRHIDRNGDESINERELRLFVEDESVSLEHENQEFVPMYRPEHHDDEIQGRFSKNSALRVADACKTLRRDILK